MSSKYSHLMATKRKLGDYLIQVANNLVEGIE